MKSAAIKALALVGVIATGSLAALQVRESIGELTTRVEASSMDAVASPQAAPESAPPAELTATADNGPTPLDELAAAAAEPIGAVRGQGGDLPPSGGQIAQSDLVDPFAADGDPFAAPAALAEPADATPIGRASLDTLNPAENADPFAGALPEVRPAGQPPAVEPTVDYAVVPATPSGDAPTDSSPIVQAAAQQPAPLAEDDMFSMELLPADVEEPGPNPFDFGGPLPEDDETLPGDAATAAEPPTFDLSGGYEPAAPLAQQPEPAADFGPVPEPTLDDLSDDGFDLSPLPNERTAVLPEPMPAAAAVAEPELPPAGGLSLDAAPSPAASPNYAPMPGRPAADDFIGEATINRDVPRGAVRPHVEITKTAPERAVIGEPLVYEIRLTNTGESPARSVVIEDRIPRGSKLMGTSPRAEMPEQSKMLLWRFDQLNPGQTEVVKIRVQPMEAGSIGSIATVRFMAETAAETRIAAPQLAFQLVGPGEAELNEEVTYQFQISNTGDEDARDVVVRTLVPAGLRHPGGDDLEYPVGTVPAGESKTVNLPVQAVETGDAFQTHATLEYRGGAPIDSVSPIRIIERRLSIGRGGPGKRFVGSPVTYKNAISNNSSSPLKNVRVTETLPRGVKFQSASDGGRLSPDGRQVEWLIPSIPGGGQYELSISFIPQQTGLAESTIAAVAADSSQAGIRAKMNVVGFAALKVDAQHQVRPYQRGEQVSMRVVIRNGGTAAAGDVGTTIEIPDQLRLVSVNGDVPYRKTAPNLVTFDTLDAVAEGESIAVDLVFDAIANGDARVRVQLQSAALDRPIVQEASIRVIGSEGVLR